MLEVRVRNLGPEDMKTIAVKLQEHYSALPMRDIDKERTQNRVERMYGQLHQVGRLRMDLEGVPLDVQRSGALLLIGTPAYSTLQQQESFAKGVLGYLGTRAETFKIR